MIIHLYHILTNSFNICQESNIFFNKSLMIFEVAGEFYSELGYTLVLEKAYVPESKLEDKSCCTSCSRICSSIVITSSLIIAHLFLFDYGFLEISHT